MRYLVLIATLLGWLIFAPVIQAYYLDTPHNESNGIYCYTCHEMPEMLNSSIDWASRALVNPDDTLKNLVCNSCHSANPTNTLHRGPVKKLHASSTTTASPSWSTECTQCHNAHFQGQLDWNKDDYAKLYLVAGVFSTANGARTYTDPNPLVEGDDYTSIGFATGATLVAQPGFEDTSKWKSKGGATSSAFNMDPTRAVDGSRGLVLVPNRTTPAETFEVINATANTITVRGRMVRDAINGGPFAIIYGQSIKSSVMPNGGLVANDRRDVKYYTPKLIAGTYGGHVDLTPDTTQPVGLCQVCHTSTAFWLENGGLATHYPTTDCKTCHNILTGGGAVVPNFAPVANAGVDQNVATGILVTLSGSGSSDANGDMLTYTWSLTSRPGTSSATLSGANTIAPTFTADAVGSYVVSLVVSDGKVSSPIDQVIVTVVPDPDDVDLGLGFTEQQGGGGLVGETVRVLNGNVIEARSDLALLSPNSFGLGLSAFYNSRSLQSGVMGYGWSHSYEVTIDSGYFIGSHNVYRLVDQTGRVSYFDGSEINQRHNGLFHEKSYLINEGGDLVWQRTDGSRFGFGFDGKLSWIDDEKGNRLDLFYNNGQLDKVVDQATGRMLTFVYNGDWLDRVLGPTTPAIPDDPYEAGVDQGIWVKYGYDANNNLTSVRYGDGTPPNLTYGSGFKYEYTDPHAPHNLSAQRDNDNHLLATWGYDASDRCLTNSSVNGSGASIIAYNSPTQVAVTDAYGVTRVYTIAELNGRKRVTTMSGLAGAPYGGDLAAWEYDSDLNLTKVIGVGGAVHRYQDYDANGNPQTVILGEGAVDLDGQSLTRTIHYTFHPLLNTVLTRSEPSVLGSGDKVTVYDYDDPADPSDNPNVANDHPTNLVHRINEQGYTRDGNSQIVAFAYQTTVNYSTDCGGLGLLGSVDGPRTGIGDLASFTYDPATCNLLAVNLPEGLHQTLAEYDNAGFPGQITGADDQTDLREYDGRARVVKVTHAADSSFAAISYTRAGQPLSQTDEDGVVYTYTYHTTTGKPERVTDGVGNYIQYGYDTQGNQTSVEKFDVLGTRSFLKTYSYTGATIPGQLYTVTSGDSTTYYGYDVAGNRATVTDPENHVTTYSYDAFNRLVEAINPGDNGSIFTYYNGQGNLDRVKAQVNNDNPPEFVVTDYEYDDLGRSLLEVSADTNDTHLIYDPAGNLERKVDANGVIVSYTYDQLNRPTAMAFPNDSADNTSDLFLTYDTASHGLGKLANLVEKDNGGAVTGSTSYGYDSRGRWAGLTSTINGRSFTVGRSHTSAGRLAEMTYPSGRTVTFAHNNNLGQVSDVTATVGGQSVALAANLAYYPFGPVGGLATGNGGSIVNQTGECGCGVVVSNSGTVNERIYSYDGNKNLTGLSMPQKPWKNEVYTYDPLQRLESATTPAGSFVYSYDFLGNRLAANSNGKTETYAQIIASNVLDKVTSTAGTTQYYYDNYGNTTGIGARIFAYDKRNRLLQVTEGATTLGSYQYNGFNQRVSKTAAGATTLFVHDFDGNIIAEAQSDGSIKSEFLYWGSSRLARVDKDGANERLYYFLNDRMGTPVALTNTSNAAVWEAVYEPFGKAEANRNSSVVNNFRFPGQYYDAETGLHYNWNRYYNPATGRYITPDPIGLAGGINPFVYVGSDPINWIDPWGLDRLINSRPAGPTGPTITFINNVPGGPSVNQPVTDATAAMIEKAVSDAGVDININSTTGGTHSPTSRHPSGLACDIDTVDGKPATDANQSANNLQESFNQQPNIRENYGPFINTKTDSSGVLNQKPQVAPSHGTHIHVSGQR